MMTSPKKSRIWLVIVCGLLIFSLCWMGWRIRHRAAAVPKESSLDSSERAVSSASTPVARSRVMEPDLSETPTLASEDNAATYWREAFALIDRLSAREKSIMREKPRADPPTDEEIAALLVKIDPIILLLQQGAAKTECDWGTSSMELNKPLPHVSKGVILVQIALWDAEQRIASQPDEAMQNITALQTFALSFDHLLLGGLLNAGFHANAYRFISENALHLDKPNRLTLLATMNSSRLVESLQKSLLTEIDFTRTVFSHLAAGKKPDGSPLEPKSEIAEYQAFYGTTPIEIAQNRIGYEQMIELVANSLVASEEKFEAEKDRLLTKYPAMYSPGVEMYAGARQSARRTLTMHHLVRAGLMVMDEGPAALTRTPDPITGRPYHYRVIDDQGAFELESDVRHKDKPIKLTFGAKEQAP